MEFCEGCSQPTFLIFIGTDGRMLCIPCLAGALVIATKQKKDEPVTVH
ncbi:MAG: hypothetical protein WBV94_04000 [Blastocatellia bacterium]